MKYSRHFPDFFYVCVCVCHASSHFKLSFIFISIYILLFHVAFPRLLQLFAKKKQRKSFSRHRRATPPASVFYLFFIFTFIIPAFLQYFCWCPAVVAVFCLFLGLAKWNVWFIFYLPLNVFIYVCLLLCFLQANFIPFLYLFLYSAFPFIRHFRVPLIVSSRKLGNF